MKSILYLTFYFEPDICAGSFRNSPLAKRLASEAKGKATVDVLTTMPNRYSSYEAKACEYEKRDNYTIRRISIPGHQSGMADQIFSFKTYFNQVRKYTKGKKYDLVIASSSRLFTAYLGYRIAKKINAPLYLDIRDIFYDTMEDVLHNNVVKKMVLPFIKRIEKKTFDYAAHINLISPGFKPYFEPYNNATYSYFPNGIDEIFAVRDRENHHHKNGSAVKSIVYAGNIGEGQGLHKIIPEAARALEGKYKFLIIGDGGAKKNLVHRLKALDVKNVEMRDPIKRSELLKIYDQADYLFVHLNNYKAFEKVLPSKLFELATYPKPLIAGIGGFSASFVKSNIENSILFEPCNVKEFVEKLESFEYKQLYRTVFIERFRRAAVNKDMVATMLALICPLPQYKHHMNSALAPAL